jgi:ribosome-binding factor A
MRFRKHARRGHASGARLTDPVDPDVFFSDAAAAKPEHHTRALCKQVQRTLTAVLGGECADPVLQDLLVLAVLPAPNAGHLLAIVSPRSIEATLADCLERLSKVTPLLRARIAQDTTRKRTPQLSFDVLGRGVLALETPCEEPESYDDLPPVEDLP